MAHGKNVQKKGHIGREYWSYRLKGCLLWGKFGKTLTHRKERREIKKEIRSKDAE